ncbi:MAG: acyl carrier protein [Kiritimatiellia bacterium]
MNEDIMEKLAEIFEVDTVAMEDVLRDFENWDSLAALSIIAMCDSTYGFTLPSTELRTIKTVGALVDVIVARKTK